MGNVGRRRGAGRIFLGTAVLLMSLGDARGALAGDSSYADSIRAWQESRVTRLTSETGWLSVAGLFWLEPGETRTVTLDLTPESLAFYDVNMKWVVEPGQFEILVGTSSRDADLQKTLLTVLD